MNAGSDDPVPTADPQTQPDSGGPPPGDAGPGPQSEPLTIPEDLEFPPGDRGDTRREMDDVERHRFWWRKLFAGVVIWDFAYLVVLPLVAGMWPVIGSIPIPDDARTFTNTVTAIVTAGVILAVTKLPLPWGGRE